METIFLLINLLSTVLIAGIMWFVQLVHYPLFNAIPARNLINYGYYHTRKISGIIKPLFIVDFTTLLLLLILLGSNLSTNLMMVNIVIFIITVILTQIVFIPIHQKLSKSPNSQTISQLIRLNWIRTLIWSLKVVFMLIIIYETLFWKF
jgi:hypothetical protein